MRLEFLSMFVSPNGSGSLYLALAASVDLNEPSEKIPALCGKRDLIPQISEQPDY
jgi:hypothetical protein